MTHLVLICCESATTHDYIKRIVQDIGPYISLPALTCMIGVLIVRVIWLGQMLSEEGTIADVWGSMPHFSSFLRCLQDFPCYSS